MSVSLSGKITGEFVFALLGLIGFVSFRSTTILAENSQWIDHTYRVHEKKNMKGVGEAPTSLSCASPRCDRRSHTVY
ncbi:MAG: hypothetical protein HYR77_03110 [Ignavibacteria bacterium]|nr:hypothetical protein [Ignavibacteria bacterium]